MASVDFYVTQVDLGKIGGRMVVVPLLRAIWFLDAFSRTLTPSFGREDLIESLPDTLIYSHLGSPTSIHSSVSSPLK